MTYEEKEQQLVNDCVNELREYPGRGLWGKMGFEIPRASTLLVIPESIQDIQ